MEIKKLLILALSFIKLSTIHADPIALENLSSTLINLEAKAEELGKIKESEYKKYYKDLRIAIHQSLIDRKLDIAVLSKLEESSAKRAAIYVLELLFKQKHGTLYKVHTLGKTPEGKDIMGNFELQYPNYKPLVAQFDTIVDQILLISRLVDYIIANYKKDEDASILSIDTFDSIFNAFFALALYKEQIEPQLEPYEGKLHLTILSDSLDEEDFKSIKKSIEETEGTVNHYENASDLLSSKPKFDIYLFNEKFTFKAEQPNATVLKKDNKVVIFCFENQNFVAISRITVPEDERKSLFNYYINKLYKIPKIYNEEAIKDYNAERGKIPSLFMPLIIDKTRNQDKNIATLFILGSDNHWISELYLPILKWPDIFGEMWKFNPAKATFQIFKYDEQTKEFVKYEDTALKGIKAKQIKW